MGLPLVSVNGPPGECGTAYGAAVPDMVGANLDAYLRRFQDQAGLGGAEVTAAGEAFRAATIDRFPRVAAMLDGVAAGAGVPVAEVYALNARTELLYGHPRECTAIGVLGTHTATGQPLLGQNWDWYPDQRDLMLVLRTTDEREHTVLTLAEAGMLAKTGLSSAGVGQCLTMLGCDRDGLTDPPGVPYHVLARATLEADSLALAIRTAVRSPRNASINLLLAQVADRGGGELLDLELVPGDVGWLHPADGLLTHANHLETPLPVRDVQRDLGGSSLFRAARARRLVDKAVAVEDLAEVFRDHASFPHGICRHLDERDPPLDQAETVCSVILDLANGRVGTTAGPPCRSEYTWLS